MQVVNGDDAWCAAPDTLTLAPDQVHVWRARLDLPATRLRDLQSTLAEEERRRAERFLRPEPRARFIAARGLLREILSLYLRTGPSELVFEYDQHGKPHLVSNSSQHHLEFNLSHSQQLAVYAITRNIPIGIDVEFIRPDSNLDRIAERFFSPLERRMLNTLPADSTRNAFFACWTRKEAYLKARGVGLTTPLHQFSVSVMPDEPPRVLMVDREPAVAAQWSLHQIIPHPEYIATVAVAGQDLRLKYFELNQSD